MNLKKTGTTGSPSLYANIPILNIKNNMNKEKKDINTNKNPESIEKRAEKVIENTKINIEADASAEKKEEIQQKNVFVGRLGRSSGESGGSVEEESWVKENPDWSLCW